MITRRFIAADMRQALRNIQQILGDEAVILGQRTLADGTVEVEAMVTDPGSRANASVAVEAGPTPAADLLLHSVFQELNSLRRFVAGQGTSGMVADLDTSRQYIAERLGQYGLLPGVIRTITNRLDVRLPPDALWQQTLDTLQDLCLVTKADMLEEGGIIALMGATGVGKSTTIAKLATQYVLRQGCETITLISTDYYKMGAHEQFALLKKILNVECFTVNTPHELKSLLETLSAKPLILIDTAGIGMRDQARLKNQLEILQVGERIEYIVTLAANSEQQALQETLALFATCTPLAAILTKVDECMNPGPVMSVLMNATVPLAYISEGQRIPYDLRRADRPYLLNWLQTQSFHQRETLASSARGESADVY